MKVFLIILGLVLIATSTMFFLWFSAMGCMSTTAAACNRNDFATMEAVYLFYIPVAIGLLFMVFGVYCGRKKPTRQDK